jgi:hypothetical protein
VFLLGTMLWLSSNPDGNCQNILKFLLSSSLLLQWWFVTLSMDKLRRPIVSFIQHACFSKAQAAELRRTHPVRPPPKPNSNFHGTNKQDPRLLRKKARQEAKQLSADIVECSLRGKVVLFPLMSGCAVHYLLRCHASLWPVWIVAMLHATAFWVQQVLELASQEMDKASNNTNNRPTLAFVHNNYIANNNIVTPPLLLSTPSRMASCWTGLAPGGLCGCALSFSTWSAHTLVV